MGDLEILLALPVVVPLVVVLLVGGSVLGIVGFVLALRANREMQALARRMETLRAKLEELAGSTQSRRWEAVRQEPSVCGLPPARPASPPIVEEAAAAPAAPGGPPPGVLTAGAGPARERWDRLEQAAGKRWIAWAGALVLFLAAGFFVKYAFDQGWLGPTARVVLGVAAGVVFLVAGDVCVRRRMRALGQALMGGGLATLYVSLFAGFSLYHLVAQPAAFGAMVVVTAAGAALALLHGALPVGFLAVLGGLLTPVLCSTGEDARDALFTYLVVLDLGVIAVALFKHWRALDVLAFVGTWGLFAGWHHQFYAPGALVPAMAWLAAFFVIFLLLPVAHHFMHGTPIPLERFEMELLNATVAFAYAYVMLHAKHQPALGFVALGMAGCYVAMAALARRRTPADARGLFGFAALAVLFLTIAVPLRLGFHGILVVWAAEGAVLLYLGYRFQYLALRIGSFAVLALAVVRLFVRHWPLHEVLFAPIWNRHFGAAMCVPAAAAVFALIHHQWRKGALGPDRTAKITAAIAAWLLAIVILQAEIGQWLIFSAEVPSVGRYLAGSAEVALWAVAAAGLLAAGVKARSVAPSLTGLAALAIGAVLAATMYAHTPSALRLVLFNARFCSAVLVPLVAFAYGLIVRRFRELRASDVAGLAKALSWTGTALLLLVLSLEAYTFCIERVSDPQKARWTALMSLSIVWGVYAAGMLAVGFWRRVRSLRLAALALFAATALKLVLVDLAGIKQVYRIISFLVLGLLMVAVSYLYHLVEKRFMQSAGEQR